MPVENATTVQPRTPMHPEAVSDLILAAVVILVIAAFGACAYSVEEAASIADLLVVAATVSGITIPVCIAYLSLGRAVDPFSEIGDAIPFFKKKHHMTDADLTFTKLLLIQSKDMADREFLADIYALEEISSLGAASGIYLSHAAKLRLIPTHLHRQFCKHFENNHDHDALPVYSAIVGVLAVACILALYLSHFGVAGSLFWASEHFLIVSTMLANLSTYSYLLDMSLVRRRVQHAAAHKGEELCKRVHLRAPEPAKNHHRRIIDILVQTKNATDELKTKPQLPAVIDPPS